MPPPRLEDALHAALVELTRHGEHYLAAFAEALSPGLRRGPAQPLLRVHRNGPMRVSALAHDLALDTTTVTRHVDELESRGLIERVADVNDRRAVLVQPTPHALAKLDAADADCRARLRSALADWPEHDRREFARLLSSFAKRPELARELDGALHG